MVLVTNNWRVWMVGMVASLVIFAVVYFAVIAPSENTANQLLKSGLQQSQQAIKQAQKQAATISPQAGAASSQAGAASSQAGAASGQAQQVVTKAEKLASCVTAAGTDTTKIQNCQVKYSH